MNPIVAGMILGIIAAIARAAFVWWVIDAPYPLEQRVQMTDLRRAYRAEGWTPPMETGPTMIAPEARKARGIQ